MTGPTVHSGVQPTAEIGPNAVLQTLVAVRELAPASVPEVLRVSGLGDEAPTRMIPEAWFIDLVRAVRRVVPGEADGVLRRAGALTAAYVRKNRVPSPIRAVLAALPRKLAMPALLRAIARHAWTFAGSGVFHVEGSQWLVLEGSPTSRAGAAGPLQCGYYEAAFEGLLQLAHPGVRVHERCCQGAGAPACRFELVASST
jgi:divinyl protochlorophyllide a 8-vinyl-reductase